MQRVRLVPRSAFFGPCAAIKRCGLCCFATGDFSVGHDFLQVRAATNADVHASSKHSDLLTEVQMRDLQKQNLRNAPEQSNGQVSGKDGAAALLDIRPTTLSDRISSFGLKKPRR